LDALSKEDYFEEKFENDVNQVQNEVIDNSFKGMLQKLNTNVKRGKTCYQCPFCLKFYGENGMYSHIDAENGWKRRCKE
jgi:hypothetical protein